MPPFYINDTCLWLCLCICFCTIIQVNFPIYCISKRQFKFLSVVIKQCCTIPAIYVTDYRNHLHALQSQNHSTYSKWTCKMGIVPNRTANIGTNKITWSFQLSKRWLQLLIKWLAHSLYNTIILKLSSDKRRWGIRKADDI